MCECMFVSLSVSECHMCVGAHECQKGALDPLELQSQVGAKDQT